jgi:competence protein ComEC
MKLNTCTIVFFVWALLALAVRADLKTQTLDVYWIDCEGGAATLLVTPAGEAVLIDAGHPGGRDAARILAVAKTAGLAYIDFCLLTNFEESHMGGAAELAHQLPLLTLYTRAIPAGFADSAREQQIQPLRSISDRRRTFKAGVEIPLRTPANVWCFTLCCLAADQEFIDHAAIWAPRNGRTGEARDIPPSDRDNSAVLVLQFNDFRFFVGSDVTWNVEARLVTPYNLAGAIDVYQTDQHGLDDSNNPMLFRTIAPTVVVMTNGPRTGGETGIFATVREKLPWPTLYQLHESLNVLAPVNAPAEFVANRGEDASAEKCPANFIKMVVAPDGQSYTISIPANGHSRIYQTRTEP